MLIRECGNSIHTFFMRLSIDLAFVDRKGVLRHAVHELKPWRVAIAPVLARTDCIELPAGTLRKTETEVGDELFMEA
jgi:uncharacterized membrane protein (UPF0127 family)